MDGLITAISVRVGNLITDMFGRILVVDEIKQTGIRCIYRGEQNTMTIGMRNSLFPFEDLMPIPLTEHIATLCGFKMLYNNSDANNCPVSIYGKYGVKLVFRNLEIEETHFITPKNGIVTDN